MTPIFKVHYNYTTDIVIKQNTYINLFHKYLYKYVYVLYTLPKSTFRSIPLVHLHITLQH